MRQNVFFCVENRECSLVNTVFFFFLHYKTWTLGRISDKAVREEKNVPRNSQTQSRGGGSGGQYWGDRVMAQDPGFHSCLCFLTLWKTPGPDGVADVNGATGDSRSSLVPHATSPSSPHCGDFFP